MRIVFFKGTNDFVPLEKTSENQETVTKHFKKHLFWKAPIIAIL